MSSPALEEIAFASDGRKRSLSRSVAARMQVKRILLVLGAGRVRWRVHALGWGMAWVVPAVAGRDDWFACEPGIDELLHGFVRPVSKAQRHDDDIGGIEGFRAGHIGGVFWIDGVCGGIDSEQDGALEPVTFGQDFGQLRHSLLRTVFFVTGEEDYMLANTGPGLSLINDKVFRLRG